MTWIVTVVVAIILSAASVALSEILRPKPELSAGVVVGERGAETYRVEKFRTGLFTEKEILVAPGDALPAVADCEWCGSLIRMDTLRCASCGAPRRNPRRPDES